MPPKVHAIADLLRLLPNNLTAKLPSELIKLDLLYTSTRYPGVLPAPLVNSLPGQQEAEDALRWAQQTMALVEQHLST